MNSAIEARETPVYRSRMRSALLRLLAFVAVLLMPFGMGAAPAAGAMQHRQLAMPMQHCPEPDSSRHSTAALAGCAMACASAIPAADLEITGAHPVSKFTPEPMLVPALSGIELETATPPPRPS